jgi:hypothetical protein
MQDDFVYEKIRYQYIAAYLSLIKKKANGKIRSISDYRKYYDALQFGCRQQKASFQNEFKPGMQDLLEACYRKEYKCEEQKGNVEKMYSDPISRPLYLLLLTWALETGNIFALVFSILQWTCMGRSVNIDPLGFPNFHMGADSIKVLYDFTTSEKDLF